MSDLGVGVWCQWYVRTLLVSCNKMGTNGQGVSVFVSPGGLPESWYLDFKVSAPRA